MTADEGPGGPAAGAGRFAPSPSGALHLGNLRTALLAWLFARSTGREFLIRIEDLDRVAPGAAGGQLRDLAALGIDHDRAPVRQRDRTQRYADAIEQLVRRGLTYECFCTRREIREAALAPHGAPLEGRYRGICRRLGAEQIAVRRAAGRPPALRLKSQVASLRVVDRQLGTYTGMVEDIVLRRNDGLAAYNLAVVVDDHAQGVDQVVRGDDLLPSTPAQVHLSELLEIPIPEYAHVPLALNPAGQRLAKRDGAVTLPDLIDRGWTPGGVLDLLAGSLGMTGGSPAELLTDFRPAELPRTPWIVDPTALLPL